MAEVGGASGTGSTNNAGQSSGGSNDKNSDTASTANSTGGSGAATLGDSSKDNSATEFDAGNSRTGTSLASSATSADNLASSPTTADTIAGQPASKDTLSGFGTNTAVMNSSSAAETLADMADKAKNFLSEDHSAKGSLYTNKDQGITVAGANAEYTAPHRNLDNEKSQYNAGVGVKVDATFARLTSTTSATPAINVSTSITLGTVNANAELSGNAEFKGLKSNVSGKASVGAEAMAIDGKLSGEISITPKTVGDTFGGMYNTFIDPMVDWVAGKDVAGIPEAPDSWDHGPTVAGHIVSGYGASAKWSGGLDIGNGQGVKLGFSWKLGVGPVIGQGFSIGVK